MALDSRFICSSDLQSIFLDKLDGEPLSAGVVTFYSDVNRTVKKAVYQLTGAGSTLDPYAFSALTDPVTLNSIGGYQYNGNSIALYYFPFECTTDGDPTTASNVVELYYVTVENSGSQSQFSRGAWPPLASNIYPAGNSGNGVKNYIPNGQFLSHNDHPITTTNALVTTTNDAYQIAQGGWTFQQTQGSTGVYTITFNSLISGIAGLTEFPAYAVVFTCVSHGNESQYDLSIQWPDVNVFSETLNSVGRPTTNPFNLLFAAKSLTGATAEFELVMTRYFGTGGSLTLQAGIGTVTVGTDWEYHNMTVLIPDNSAYNVGDGSYFGLSLRGPASTFSCEFTNFAFTLGEAELTQFPIMTNDEMLSRGVAGWMPTPNPDGSDLYLPLVLTNQGMTFDHSIVGQIIGKTQIAAVNNELLMDGSNYVRSAYSSIGIPYSRLSDYLITNSTSYTEGGGATIPANSIPLFGTGLNYVSVWDDVVAGDFILNFNTANGANAAVVATASPTGFTIGALTTNNRITFTIPAKPAASTYFSFTPQASGLVFNVYFTVDGVGTAPATPTGANIEVAIVTADTIATVIPKIQAAIHKYRFCIVDARGYFWRGLGGVDPNSATRAAQIFYNGSAVAAADLASGQADAYIAHTHIATSTIANVTSHSPNANPPTYIAGTDVLANATSHPITTTVSDAGGTPAGGLETRPVNLSLNWYIKY
jgi:hypothetical protein